ncbi:MAG: SurA N-terminal domain-containing protein [Thiohalomonadaceae bacterium]
MLHFIRERAQSWIAWVIVVLIIVPFALWGINQYFDGGKEIPAAKVNDTEISPQYLQQALYQQQMRLREMLGANYRADMFPEEGMRQQVLEGLIEQELLIQTANSSGMRVSNALLASTIHGIPTFQNNGQFSRDSYEMALRNRGMDPRTFESDLRRDMLVQQLYAGVVRSDFVTATEREAMQQLFGQQRDIGFLVLPMKDFIAKAEISDAEIQAYYDEQSTSFMRPEQVSVAYLELAIDQIAQGIEINDADLQARYQTNLSIYTTPEERHARHILIQVPASADESVEAEALSKIEQLQVELRAGAAFADLASKQSQDSVSAANGGDLGFFARGIMDKLFEEAVFALKPGEISEPVRSVFGYHLIKLEAVRGGETKEFAEVKDQLRDEMRKERAEQQYHDQAEQLATLTYEHPDSLDEAASKLSLEIKQSEPFSRQGGAWPATDARVISAAFSDDVLVRNNNSEVIEIGRNHMLVLRVLQHLPEEHLPLVDVRDDIVANLKQTKATLAAHEASRHAQEKLQQGATPENMAKETGGKWLRQDAVRRDTQDLDGSIVSHAFAMPRPQADKTVWDFLTTTSGDKAVLGVYAVRDGEVAEGELDISADLEQAAGEAAFAALVASRRSSAKITRPARQE